VHVHAGIVMNTALKRVKRASTAKRATAAATESRLYSSLCRCTLHRAVNKLPTQLRKQQFVVVADSAAVAAAVAVNFVRTHVAGSP